MITVAVAAWHVCRPHRWTKPFLPTLLPGKAMFHDISAIARRSRLFRSYQHPLKQCLSSLLPSYKAALAYVARQRHMHCFFRHHMASHVTHCCPHRKKLCAPSTDSLFVIVCLAQQRWVCLATGDITILSALLLNKKYTINPKLTVSLDPNV